MAFIFALLGLLAMLAGGAAIAIGWPQVPLEFGWTLVIAGSASASGGLVCLAIAGLIFETRRMRVALVEAMARRPAAGPQLVEGQMPADAVAAPPSEAPAAEPVPAAQKSKDAEPEVAETKPNEAKIASAKPFEPKPFEPKRFESMSAETKGIEPKSFEAKPAEAVAPGETKPESAAKIELAKIEPAKTEPARAEPAMTFARIADATSSMPPRAVPTGFSVTLASPAAVEPVTAPADPASAGPARPEPIPAGPAPPRPLRFEPKVAATRPAAPRIEPALPGKADISAGKPELQDDVEHEAEAHLADGHNGRGDTASSIEDEDAAEELRPARSFSVGETTFIVFTDGSIEARTPKGAQRFDTMEDVRAYLHESVH